MLRSSRVRRAGAAVFVTCMLAAGCGGGDDAASTSTTTEPSSSGATSPSTSAVKADLSPIKVGFRNIDAAVPEISTGFEVGIDYVNEVLGGVNGHPIEVSTCSVDGSPEKAIDCANQFIEQGVVLSVQGADPQADAALPALEEAGIAETGVASLGPVQSADVGHSFMFTNPGPTNYIAAVVALAQAGGTNLRFFQGDSATARADNDKYLLPAADTADVEADSIYYSQGNADWPSLVATAVADGADAMGVLIASEADCTAMIAAAVQIGFTGPILAGNCRQFVDAVGSEATTNVYTFGDLYPPDVRDAADKEQAAQIDAFVDRMNAAGHGDLLSGFAAQAFSLAVTLADALTQIQDGQPEGTDLTAEAIRTGFRGVRGDRFMGGPYNCDGSAFEGSSSCQLAVLLFKQQEDGSRQPVGKGYLDLDQYVGD
jgi:branched-chain amino acid transport system substrate-binding protein